MFTCSLIGLILQGCRIYGRAYALRQDARGHTSWRCTSFCYGDVYFKLISFVNYFQNCNRQTPAFLNSFRLFKSCGQIKFHTLPITVNNQFGRLIFHPRKNRGLRAYAHRCKNDKWYKFRDGALRLISIYLPFHPWSSREQPQVFWYIGVHNKNWFRFPRSGSFNWLNKQSLRRRSG